MAISDKIQKAIDKIDKEAEELGGGQFMVIASHIIEKYLASDENADKVLDESKSLKKCIDDCKSKARAEAVGNVAMIADETVYGWVKEYYGFSDCSQLQKNKIIDLFDVL